MKVVIALGGNALLERGEAPDSDIQETHVVSAVTALAPLAGKHQLLITHGNGPQVGMLAPESARDPALSHPSTFPDLWLGLMAAYEKAAADPAAVGRQEGARS